MNANSVIEKTYEDVQKKNSGYKPNRVLKTLLGLGIVAELLLPVTADAQTRKQIIRQPPAQARMNRISRLPGYVSRMPVMPQNRLGFSHGFFPNVYYSRGFFGSIYYGGFIPFGFGPYSGLGIAREMFCRIPVRSYAGAWAVPYEQVSQDEVVKEYQNKLNQLRSEVDELKKRQPEKETVYVEKKDSHEYRIGYQNGGMDKSQWVPETTSYFNWYFNLEGNMLHAYSHSKIVVDGKTYYFDNVIKDEQTGKPIYIFEFPDGDQFDAQKRSVIESDKLYVPAYLIVPGGTRGYDLEIKLEPYKDKILGRYK